jgi:small subunit ribosomal protein S10
MWVKRYNAKCCCYYFRKSTISKTSSATSLSDLEKRKKTPSEPVVIDAFLPTPVVPQRHGVHVGSLHFRSFGQDVSNMDFFVDFCRRAAAALDIACSTPKFLHTRTRLVTVPRSPFAHKRSQQNFWRRTHARSLDLYDAHEEVVEVLFAYLRENGYPNVEMDVQRVKYRPVNWGSKLASNADLRQSVIDENLIEELKKELEGNADAAVEANATGEKQEQEQQQEAKEPPRDSRDAKDETEK